MTWTKVIVVCVILLGLFVKVTQAGEIHGAVRDGKLWEVEKIIKNAPKQIDTKDNDFSTPLHLASQGGYKDIAKLLIDKGADVNAKDKDGYTPLHVAAELGYIEIAELLIAAGSDVNAEDTSFRTPLHLASQGGHEDIVKLLIAKGGAFNVEDKEGWTPLDYAGVYDHNEIADFLTSLSERDTLKYKKMPSERDTLEYKKMPEIELPEIELYATVTVFYGTDRKKTGDKTPNNYYGSELELDSFEYGICEVSIPEKKHVKGEIERPSWWEWLVQWGVVFNRVEDPARHVVLLYVNPMVDTEFFSKLRESINKYDERAAFVFVHGFDTTFADAAQRTAQIAYDLCFKGAPIMYSWPSRGTKGGYLGDEDNIRLTVKSLEKFLNKIISDTKANKVHLIAHSMGNRALTDALKELDQRYKKPLFNQVVLAAPDIDARIFVRDIVPAIKGTSKRITLYVSSADHALHLSRMIRNWNYPRAGESGNDIVVVNGIDTIDASEVNTDLFGHGYFANTEQLIKDMHYLLLRELPPGERNLPQREKNHIRYWFFPKAK